MFRSESHEFELGQGGEREFTLPPPTEDAAPGDAGEHGVLVTLELLEGDPAARDDGLMASWRDGAAEGGGLEEDAARDRPSRHRLLFGFVPAGARIDLWFRSAAGGRFRLTVTRFARALKNGLIELRCDACIEMAKQLARALVIWAGGVTPGDVLDVLEPLADLDFGEFYLRLKGSKLWRFIERSGLEAMAMILFPAVIAALRAARKVEEALHRFVCEMLGMCVRGAG
ncbi:hypothetical protein D1610_01435 [Sphingomonas gilva]|uniref:Uncharacterized protein n=1 Tax=Sphingomonas gilva TaxID=2305907 RepID=A0A396RYN2_9SPHN|nr:hypothetical protein [Sphingomonas gilva]RHW18841.1 hypothetical protein D1610_01435 [Sphingomonas gilva]